MSEKMPEDLRNKVIRELTNRFASMIESEYGVEALTFVSEIISERVYAAVEDALAEGWDG